MGTNYYLKPKLTEDELAVIEKYHASLPEIHIGKSSYGWTFSFHAVTDWEYESLIGYTGNDLPKRIESASEWKQWTDDPAFEIYDEYRQKISSDEFWAKVESKKSSKHNHAKKGYQNSFLDVDGNSFTRGEFC